MKGVYIPAFAGMTQKKVGTTTNSRIKDNRHQTSDIRHQPRRERKK